LGKPAKIADIAVIADIARDRKADPSQSPPIILTLRLCSDDGDDARSRR
jgi:hypothetical protein